MRTAWRLPMGLTLLMIAACAAASGKEWVNAGASVRLPAAAPAMPRAGGALAIIEGHVLGATGAPVPGARVAVNSADPDSEPTHNARPIAMTRAGADGSFRVEVPPQRVALTASSPRMIPALLLDRSALAGSPLQVDLRLGGLGVEVRGKAVSLTGAALRDLDLRIVRASEVTGDIFLPEVESGAFSMTIDPAWRVAALAAAYDHVPLTAPQWLVPGRDAAITLQDIAHDERPAPAEVVAWIRHHAVPLGATTVGHGDADLEAVGAALGAPRVVAVGEATHGSAEFFQLKHRILEYLVSQRGFTLFGIEADGPDALAANDYVLGNSEVDPYKVVAQLRLWTWNTEEVVELVRWLRAWNSDPAHAKVHFFGFDMQAPVTATRRMFSYLDRVDPELARSLAREHAPIGSWLAWSGTLPADDAERLHDSLAKSIRTFDERRAAWERITGSLAFAEARRMAVLAQQAVSLYRPGADAGLRDRHMAENVLWAMHQAGPQAKAMLWAHNGHVAFGDGLPTIGNRLRDALGMDYHAIGLSFGAGGLQAYQLPLGSPVGLRDFVVSSPKPGSLDGALETTGLPLFHLDLHQLPTAGPVAEWFARSHGMKSIGSHYSDEVLPLVTVPVIVQRRYDALLFVARTSAARAAPSSPRFRQAALVPLPGPQNIDLHLGAPGALPPGWTLSPVSAQAGWTLVFAPGSLCKGLRSRRCVILQQEKSAMFTDAAGQLLERFSAGALAGKSVRVRVPVRNELTGRTDRAQISLRCAREAPPAETRAAVVPAGAEWSAAEISLLVPLDAKTCDLSLQASGSGRVLFGPPRLDVLPAAGAQGG